MIISHEHKFIFLHARKTAGSSITLYLNKYLGGSDIQLGPYTDMISAGQSFNRRFYFDFVSLAGIGLCTKMFLKSVRKRSMPTKKMFCDVHKSLYQRYTQQNPVHMPATDLKKMAPKEWRSYFKFCFVRNPYDYVVSDYKWRLQKCSNKSLTFREFLLRLEDSSRPDPENIVPNPSRNWKIYTIGDVVSVDFIGRYERLNEDLGHICERIGCPFDKTGVPCAKRSTDKSSNYREFYDEECREIVGRLFSDEIDEFGYAF